MRKLVLILMAVVCVMGVWFPVCAATNPKFEGLVTKIDRLENYVYDNNWQDIRTFIRGPLGQIRRDIALLQRELPNQQRSLLKATANKFFDDLIALDFAALDQNSERTESAFKALRIDLNKMLDVLE